MRGLTSRQKWPDGLRTTLSAMRVPTACLVIFALILCDSLTMAQCETWQPAGAGINNGGVAALAVYNGELIAGGDFTQAGGKTVNYIARWDGTEWQPFVSDGQIGTNSYVYAFTIYQGDLIVGGNFSAAGGQTAWYIARWDGKQWHPFVSGGQNGMNLSVHALAVHNGDLIAGGAFTTACGQIVNKIARWDGSTWHPFTAGGEIGMSSTGGAVFALTTYNNDLIAVGSLATVRGSPD